jgi:hypothetical protein
MDDNVVEFTGGGKNKPFVDERGELRLKTNGYEGYPVAHDVEGAICDLSCGAHSLRRFASGWRNSSGGEGSGCADYCRGQRSCYRVGAHD